MNLFAVPLASDDITLSKVVPSTAHMTGCILAIPSVHQCLLETLTFARLRH